MNEKMDFALQVAELEEQLKRVMVDEQEQEGSLLLKKIEDCKNISKTDDDGELQVYCSRNPVTAFERGVRGVIFNHNKLIYRGFPYTQEFTSRDPRLDSLDLKSCHVKNSYEGSLLKLFFFNNTWYLTTHRKLYAFASAWADVRKTFGQQFVELLFAYGFATYEAFLEELDKQKRYHFIIVNNQHTRIVIKPELQKESLYLVLVTDSDDSVVHPFPNIGRIPVSQTLQFESMAAVQDYVDNIDPFEMQGVILYSADYRQQYRILNSRYQTYMKVRNNIPCLKFCYSVCRNDPVSRKLYLELYPECSDLVDWIEERVKVIAEELYRDYKLRYIRKRYLRVSAERHGILQTIQKRYLETRKPVQLSDVRFVIDNYAFPIRLYKIIQKTDRIYH